MHSLYLGATVAVLAASVASQQLTKPALQPDLDNLVQGFISNLQITPSTQTAFQAGSIPSDCKRMAEGEGFSAADIQTWTVKYNDCSAPWIICYHRNSPRPLIDLVNTFGRLPVRTRQYVRHVISLPSDFDWAYNWGGNIAMFGGTIDNINVYFHEAAHSLDLLGAYPIKPLSSSAKWASEYNLDSAVPDPYAQSSQVENVAQNTVVTAYERNVPGGFFGLNPNANRIFHQFATVDTQQREGGTLLVKGGGCTGRLTNSAPVPVSGTLKRMAASSMPNVDLPPGLKVFPGKDFSTKGSCKGKPER